MPKLTWRPLLRIQARNRGQSAAEMPAHIRGIHSGTEPCGEYQACLLSLFASGVPFGILLSALSEEGPDADIRKCEDRRVHGISRLAVHRGRRS
jgi:hypothetical protein